MAGNCYLIDIILSKPTPYHTHTLTCWGWESGPRGVVGGVADMRGTLDALFGSFPLCVGIDTELAEDDVEYFLSRRNGFWSANIELT